MKIASIRPPGWNTAGSDNQTIRIEMTDKRWKGLLLVAFSLGVLGLILVSWQIWADIYQPLMLGSFKGNASPLAGFDSIVFGIAGAIGIALLMTSFALGTYAKFMAWWHHG